MAFLITAKNSDGEKTYSAVGDRDALMDKAYDDGALGVTIVAVA